MRIFLTGAAGFIGSHVARMLLDAGCDVVALLRPESNTRRLHDIMGALEPLYADLADTATTRAALVARPPDACIHLAWYAEPGKYLHARANITALTASLALIEALIDAGCAQVVMAGTCAEYDSDLGLLREDGPTRPQTIYAASKLSLGLIGAQLAAAAGIRFAWARLFYLYGPYEDERRLVPALLGTLERGEAFPASAGAQVRDYLHVADVSAALVTLVEQRAAGVFNIASGVPVTVRQLMETAGGLLGRSELIRFGELPARGWDPAFVCGDNQRLRTLGWAARYSLADGLRQTLEWQRSQAGEGR